MAFVETEAPVEADNMTEIIPNHKPAIVEAPETPFVAAEEEHISEERETTSISATGDSETHAPHNLSNIPKSTSKPMTIDDLPNELLSHILGFLDSPSLATDLHDEPTFEFTNADVPGLKASSCVSKRWREAVMPLLFKHARLLVGELHLESPVSNPKEDLQPFMEFVKKHSLLKIITTFVIVAKGGMDTAGNDLAKLKLDMFADFWSSLFEAIDPVELLIIAHPVILGALTSCGIIGVDAWNFDCPCHYLRLRRPPPLSNHSATNDEAVLSLNLPKTSEAHESSTSIPRLIDNMPDLLTHMSAEHSDADPKPRDVKINPEKITSTLFKIREWSSILLNEGSFIKAYSTYEFWLRQAPSILSDMLGASDQPSGPLISPTIREMHYIGMFPMASHFNFLSRHLPRLDRLHVQLVPLNNILSTPSKIAQLDIADLWMERNTCYALLMRELFNAPPTNNYKYLQVFESGDAADRDAWHMAVEYVKRAENGWRVAGDGVLERDAEDLAPEPEEGDEDADASLFEGALIRWAWNGITKLPIGAARLYEDPMGPVN